jgi:hypothetical protein
MQAVDERAEEVKRLVTLAAAMCDAIRSRSTVFGRLSARDLFLILSDQAVAEGTTEDELQALLDTLGSLRTEPAQPPPGPHRRRLRRSRSTDPLVGRPYPALPVPATMITKPGKPQLNYLTGNRG